MHLAPIASIAPIALIALGLICVAYGTAMAALYPAGAFWLVWVALGAALAATGWMRQTGTWAGLPLAARRIAAGAGLLAAIAVLGLGALIASQARAVPTANARYLIVLGASLNPDGTPKEALRYRLDAAAAYLARNPDTRCIVSGGRGADEPQTEASAMRAYLVQQGIPARRIEVEDRSTSTVENLRYARALLPAPDASCVVVTNDFHMFRALRLARKQGLANVQALAAPSNPLYLPQAALRECAAIVKDAAAGNV